MPGPIDWAQHLRTLAVKFADRPAIEDAGGIVTYRALFDHAAAIAVLVAEVIADTRNVAPGQPVATCFPNGRDAVAAAYACLLAGVAEMPLNTAYTPAEIAEALQTVPAAVAITDDAHAAPFRAAGCRVVVASAVKPVPLAQARFGAARAGDAARIVFTSGTTGRPKAVVYSNRARFVGNLLLQATLPFTPGAGSRVLLMTPFAHGTSLQTFAWLDQGGQVVLMDGVRIGEVERLLEGGTLEALFAAPTVLAKLTETFAGRRFPGIRAIFTGTAPLPPAIYARTRAMFGPVVRVTYGKTEVFNPIAVLPPDDTDAYFAETHADGSTCVGWPAPGVELRIGADDEVLIRAQHMSDGFFDASGFHPWSAAGHDGFHPSGDVGAIDERGRLHLRARLSDALKSGGYKIYPQEIERALAGASGGGETVVVGLPSDYWGEIVVAVAERPSPGWEERAKAACGNLAAFKRPRFYLALDELPRNAQGKTVRRRIVEALAAGYRLTDGPRPVLRVVAGDTIRPPP